MTSGISTSGRAFFNLVILLAAFLAIVLGCARNAPTTPQLSSPPGAHRAAGLNRVLWGVWHVALDPETLNAQITPPRNAAFTANVTRFMQPPFSPANMVQISIDPASDPSTGYFVLDITLKHSFPGVNFYSGFDVRGILMSDGSVVGTHDNTVLRAGPAGTRLLNADGYTRWWNWTEFTGFGTIFGATHGNLAPPNHPSATVNGYRYFADGLGPEEPVTALDCASRGVFASEPGVNMRRYEIQFRMDGGKPVYDFNYAVDASWEAPDPAFQPEFPPEAFPLSANCHEPFHVAVTDAGSTAWYLDEAHFGGDIALDIEVFDWQGGAKSDVAGEISALWLEGDILGGAVDALGNAQVLPGTTSCSLIYEVELDDLVLTESGRFMLFGTAESSDPTTYKPQVPGGETFSYPDAPLSAYFLSTVEVLDHPPCPEPVVTYVEPQEGIPDCTPEHVTVLGANFVDGATFRLERDGEQSIIADNVVFVAANVLEGDLTLAGALPGAWDLVVENPGGVTGALEDGFTVLDAFFVDGDNAGDPLMDGSRDHPFDTIKKGVDAAVISDDEPVIVDASAVNYAPFTVHNNTHVIGCNWSDGVGWPTVEQIDEHNYSYHVDNVTIEGLHFDITRTQMPGPIVTDHIGMQWIGGHNLTITRCKFTGEITNQGASWFIKIVAVSNLEITHCEFTEIFRRGPSSSYRGVFVLNPTQVAGCHLHHCEFHNIGFDQPDDGVQASRTTVVAVGPITRDVDIRNILIYDIFDKTSGIGMYHGNSITPIQCVMNDGTYHNVYNITVDNIRQADPPNETIVTAGTVFGIYMFAPHVPRNWKNNIVSNIIPTDDTVIPDWTDYFGYFCEGECIPPPSPQPMDYSAVYNVARPLPPGEDSSDGWYYGWADQVTYGAGCIFNYEDNDPAYDVTPGENFYHPTNPDYAQGADDGGEMGAFGGPEGDWIPPSQL